MDDLITEMIILPPRAEGFRRHHVGGTDTNSTRVYKLVEEIRLFWEVSERVAVVATFGGG
jgi:hypothetical protein